MSKPRKLSFALAVERLESRLVPDASTYVRNLYQNVLERTPNEAEVNFWVGRIQAGTSGLQLATFFTSSHEHHAREVEHAFQEILHRSADGTGVNFFANQLDSGRTSVELRQQLFASAEYRSSHPDDSTFVRGLYDDSLHRNADVGGQAFFEDQLRQGRGRDDIAGALLNSDERLGHEVHDLYATYLARTESAEDRAFWVGELHRNRGAVESIEDDFADSPEFDAQCGFEDRAAGAAVTFDASGHLRLQGTSANHDDKQFFSFVAPRSGTLNVNVQTTNGRLAELEIENQSSIKVFETQPNNGINAGSVAVQADVRYSVRLRSPVDAPASFIADLTLV